AFQSKSQMAVSLSNRLGALSRFDGLTANYFIDSEASSLPRGLSRGSRRFGGIADRYFFAAGAAALPGEQRRAIRRGLPNPKSEIRNPKSTGARAPRPSTPLQRAKLRASVRLGRTDPDYFAAVTASLESTKR
ncbi:MAG: hypothetical protein Q7S40_03655, partial [Opitutaceae bacterium]|nr:hypothetical protein [Opitutaceae bacterium]